LWGVGGQPWAKQSQKEMKLNIDDE
jgi:hypothetical protein